MRNKESGTALPRRDGCAKYTVAVTTTGVHKLGWIYYYSKKRELAYRASLVFLLVVILQQ